MRIPSGVTDQYIYFVAVDSSDLITRETGFGSSGWTVYRARNGGSATAYTTPTVAEPSTSNMPGVYALLLDEDMTIDTGDQSQEVVLHITHAGMAPVSLKYELYRPDVTAGETLTVSSGIGSANVTQFGGSNGTFASGRPETNTTHIAGSSVSTSSAQIGVNVVNAAGTAWNSGAIGANTLATDTITAAKIAADAIGASELAADAASEIGTAVWATAARTLTAGTNIQLPSNGLANVTAWTVAITGNITGNLSGSVGSIATGGISAASFAAGAIDNAAIAADAIGSSELAASAVTEIQTGLATSSALSTLQTSVDDLPTNAELATALGTADDAVLAQVALVKAKTDNLPSDPADASDIAAAFIAIQSHGDSTWATADVSALATSSDLATVDGNVDAIKAKTDLLAFTVSGQVDANIQYVNDVQVNGVGTAGNPWGP